MYWSLQGVYSYFCLFQKGVVTKGYSPSGQPLMYLAAVIAKYARLRRNNRTCLDREEILPRSPRHRLD